MRRIVMLGTGTSVGKTFVTSALARALARLEPHTPLVAFKPIETGVRRTSDGNPAPGSDAATLEAALHLAKAPRPHPLHSFECPVSPYRAAGRQPLALGPLAHAIQHAIRDTTSNTNHGTAIIETAGGCFSPLNATSTNADLAAELDPALWILVAPDALGVIHDVVATLVALSVRARMPDLLVLSAARAPDASSGGNADELRAVGVTTPIFSVTRGEDVCLELARAVIATRA